MSPDSKPSKRRTRSTSKATGADAPVTLEQVALKAGVSPSTVSRILNGTAAVSPEKQQAVEDAIEQLGFRPNPVARGLAGGRTLSVGVVTQTISSPFYGEAMYGIEGVMEQAGYVPLFVSGNWQEADERKAIETLLARRVDGLIVLAGRLPNAALLRYARELPMVVVGRQLRGPQIFSLNFENTLGARLATQHLVDLGHRRIAFLSGDLAHGDAVERLRGYEQALKDSGIPFDPALVVQGDFTEPSGLLGVMRLLDDGAPFTALFASNDQMAFGALLALHRRGLRVPDDISLVGFDDVSVAKYALPPLTTVRQSVYELGTGAARAMLALLRAETPSANLPPPELVVRESTRRRMR